MPSPVDRLRPVLAAVTGPGRRATWRRRLLRRAAAAVLAALAVVALVGALRPPPPEPTVEVGVAARALPAGAVLRADDVRTVRVARSLAPTAPARAAVGRTLAGAVEAGEPLRASRLAGGVADRLPAGTLAVAVPVGPAVASAVDVGRHVDVVVRGRALARDAVVIALAHDRDQTVTGPGESGGTTQALLAVGSPDALALAGAVGDASSSTPPVVLVRPAQPAATP